MAKRTILIVDDQKINRRILCRLLQDDYTTLEAENGREALDLLAENAENISAVLLDIVMPVMNGYTVLETMQEDAVLSKIPVIVSSQQDGDEAEIKALSLGAQDFIAKPYKAEIIRRRLSNTIRLRETAALINKAERDPLTGLYNKPFFMENVAEQLQQNPGQEYDLMCFGIERFKLINDTYGPARGNELLCYIAELLQNAQRPLFAARFTADSFYAMVPYREQYDPEVLRSWYAKVNEFPINMAIKMHCGIYHIHDRTISVSKMCDRVQLAAEKNKGVYNQPFFVYDDSLRQQLLEEQFITSNMRTALEQRQFEVYYQPKYDLNNERVAGAEALVRWNHPERGFLSPGSFIPLFERNGFITELDNYVWETACRDMRNWMDKGLPPVAISVNVSRADIYDPRLTDIMLDLVAKYNVPMRYLHLEITESAYTDNPDQIILVVNRLRDAGFVIEMDDFGSGYSSLNMLADMPVDVLKLDMRFIQSETHKTSGKGILSFVISLAKWLDLAVVAEGVETGEQIAMLRSMDCNYVQGFYYAKPMKLQDFEDLIATSATTEMICSSQTAHQYVTQQAAAEKAHLPSGREMLIVDDIELNRAVLAATFEEDYTIIEKESGSTAWDYLNEHYLDVDIVLLDLLMPVMDGFQLLERIRRDDRMKDLPVIITSQGDAKNEHRALQMQADDFISKPYNPDIIRHRVQNVLANHQLLLLKKSTATEDGSLTSTEAAFALVEELKPHFDIVRLVEPEHTLVCRSDLPGGCEIHSCYAVWGKVTRCNNCISLQALREKGRRCKLEYSENGLYFVISEYVPFGKTGAVVEMVTKLEDDYVDNLCDKKLLYARLDAVHEQLEHDDLTGIYNRRYIDHHFEELVTHAKNSCEDLGVVMVDIDNFKVLNDTYGHLAGDKVLKAVARQLQGNISVSKGDFAARFGGDEFLLVCRNIRPDVLHRRIETVLGLTDHMSENDELPTSVSISAGCTCLSLHPEMNATELLDAADQLLYRAKQNGRSQVAGDF